MVQISREEYTIISCCGENPHDPRVISCDIHNVNIPKWCPLFTTESLIKLVRKETKEFYKNLKDKSK